MVGNTLDGHGLSRDPRTAEELVQSSDIFESPRFFFEKHKTEKMLNNPSNIFQSKRLEKVLKTIIKPN